MRLRLRDTSALAAGSVLSGVLAYVFFALATRHLGADEAAAVSVLWTYWSFAAAVLTFPLQHWVARTVAADGDEATVRLAVPGIALLVGGVGLLSGLLAWIGRDPLFHRTDLWFPLLVAAVTVGSGFIGVVRGGLAARHRFLGNATVLVAENGARVVVAAVLVFAGARLNVWFGAALAAGALVGLGFPSAYSFDRDGRRHLTDERHRPSPFAFLGGAGGGQLVAQAVLTGGPVVLALSGGSAAQVTALFAGLALFRAPYTVAIGLVAQITGRLTALLGARDVAALRRVRTALGVGTALGAGVAAGIGWWWGPGLVTLIFGDTVVLGAGVSLAVAVASAVALGNLVSAVALLAQDRAHALARAWLAALAAGAVALALGHGLDPMGRTVLAFLVAEVAAFCLLLAEEVRGVRKLAPPSR
jgi:O-antigen/teichoic acid export membrane protein